MSVVASRGPRRCDPVEWKGAVPQGGPSGGSCGLAPTGVKVLTTNGMNPSSRHRGTAWPEGRVDWDETRPTQTICNFERILLSRNQWARFAGGSGMWTLAGLSYQP